MTCAEDMLVTSSLQARSGRLHGRWSACFFDLSGKPLWFILAAGEWRSPAFLDYMDLHKLDADMVLQAHLAESDDET